jgi:hypothetical protein
MIQMATFLLCNSAKVFGVKSSGYIERDQQRTVSNNYGRLRKYYSRSSNNNYIIAGILRTEQILLQSKL